MKKVFFLLFAFYTATATAQDAREFLRRMNEAYYKATSISMHFQADYYALAGQGMPTTSAKGEVKYSGQNYYSDAMGQVIVGNKNYLLIIDKAQHTITCLPGNEKGKKDKQEENAAGLPDSSWAKAPRVKLLDKDNYCCHVELSGSDPVYQKTILKINVSTYALEEVVFYYNKLENGTSPKLVVTYSDVRLNGALNPSDFSEKKYIQKKNGKLIAAPAYSNYQVIDLTQGIEIK